MSSIYTKTGDEGETSLFDGSRVKKNHLRCEAYGTIDELSSNIGLVLSLCHPQTEPRIDKLKNMLIDVQNQLFSISSELATALNTPAWESIQNRISIKQIHQLELEIDEMDSVLPVLKSFIIPGGSTVAALLHIARTICRRAERIIVSLAECEEIRPDVIKYINRLSDWLFVAARWANHIIGNPDILLR